MATDGISTTVVNGACTMAADGTNTITAVGPITVAKPDPAGLVWVENLLAPVINVAAFGGSITFSVVVADNQGAKHMPELFPIFLALAWLFFVITLGLATAAQLALSFHKNDIRKAFSDKEWATWREVGEELERDPDPEKKDYSKPTIVIVWLFVTAKLGDLLCLTMMLAFLFLSLSVVSYQFAIGIIAAIFTGAMILLFALNVLFQTLNRPKRDQIGSAGTPH